MGSLHPCQGLRKALYRTSVQIRASSTGSRLCSTDASTAGLDEWISSLTLKPKKFFYDKVDASRASQLRRILPTRQAESSPEDVVEGDLLPRSHHLIYFQPKFMLRDLGGDGSFTEYNAPPPYNRRMWAGGTMTWSKDRPLRIGQTVTQVVRVPKVELKKDMVFVQQELSVYPGVWKEGDQIDPADEGWSLRELRTHVFRRDDSAARMKSGAGKNEGSSVTSERTTTTSTSYNRADTAPISFTYTPETPLLFLYSALTYNPHKVHYDHPWSINREGHGAPLVHGPLTATLLVELASAVQGKQLREFQYRATSPMVIDEPITMEGRWKERDVLELQAGQGGRVGMKAIATFE